MYCPKCGSENPDDARFCGSCGYTIPIEKNEFNRQFQTDPNQFQQQPVSNELKIGIIIASVIVPLLGIIMGWIYMSDANPSKKAVGKTWLIVGSSAAILYCLLISAGGGCGGAGYNY
jgi:uncharacterized membrane protein YvbJ